jgi:hypothetical protein
MPGKRVQFDDATWHTLDQLATDLKTALRKSVAGMDKRPPASSVKRGGGRKTAGNDNG